MTSPHINQVRQALLDTLADLRNRDNPIDIERAKAVAHVASVAVETAKVENEFLKITGGQWSSFLKPAFTDEGPALTHVMPSANNPFPATIHRLQG